MLAKTAVLFIWIIVIIGFYIHIVVTISYKYCLCNFDCKLVNRFISPLQIVLLYLYYLLRQIFEDGWLLVWRSPMAHSKIASCLCPSAGTTVAPGWFRWPLSSTSRSTRFLCWPVISGNPWAVRGSMTASYRSGSMCSRMNTASWSVICVHHVWCAELCQGTQVLEVLGFVPFVIVRRLLTLVCYCHTRAAGT